MALIIAVVAVNSEGRRGAVEMVIRPAKRSGSRTGFLRSLKRCGFVRRQAGCVFRTNAYRPLRGTLPEIRWSVTFDSEAPINGLGRGAGVAADQLRPIRVE
jgi:hypothetical protein